MTVDINRAYCFVISFTEVYKGIQNIVIEKQSIILCHFPLESWENSSNGSWHLHGHTHHALDNTETNVYNAKSLEEAERISEVVFLTKRQILERQKRGIFLDHDLGGRTYVDFNSSGEDCGMRVAEYLSIYPTKIRANGPIIVHSLNGPAAMQMVELISEAIWVPFAWQKEVWEKFIKI